MECNFCREEKPIEDFPKWESRRWKICRSCLRKKERAYAEKNKEKMQEYRRNYRKKNKEKIKAGKKRYYSDPSNREKINASQRRYYKKHKEEIDAWRKEYNKRYTKEHPEIMRKENAKRRARKAQAPSEPWTHEEIAAQGTGFCPYCGKEIGLVYDSKIMHIDHMIPLTREGGTNLIENLEPVCCRCNMKKHNKTKEEFLCVSNCKE